MWTRMSPEMVPELVTCVLLATPSVRIAGLVPVIYPKIVPALVIWFAVRAKYLDLDRALLQSLAKFVACGTVLAATLWFTARFAAPHVAQLATLRDEAMLLLLVVVGTVVYAALILLLFGRGWLRSLVR